MARYVARVGAPPGISNNISAFGTSDIGWHFWEAERGATPWEHAELLGLLDRAAGSRAPCGG